MNARDRIYTGKWLVEQLKDIKPIDTRTDKQKIIDKYSEIFFNSDKNVIDVIGMVYDELVGKDA